MGIIELVEQSTGLKPGCVAYVESDQLYIVVSAFHYEGDDIWFTGIGPHEEEMQYPLDDVHHFFSAASKFNVNHLTLGA